jgi:hypothetical protein
MGKTLEYLTRYLLQVECRYCGDAVYPDEDDARETVRGWMDEDISSMDELRARVNRTCDGCAQFLDKDD